MSWPSYELENLVQGEIYSIQGSSQINDISRKLFLPFSAFNNFFNFNVASKRINLKNSNCGRYQ